MSETLKKIMPVDSFKGNFVIHVSVHGHVDTGLDVDRSELLHIT